MLHKRDEMFQLINMNEGMGFTKCYYLISKIDLSVWKGEKRKIRTSIFRENVQEMLYGIRLI